MLFKKLSAPSLKELFVAELEGMILSGKLEIGAKLPPERELAESMQVSRAVVNSGLDEMEKKGFLVVKPRIGTFVAAEIFNGKTCRIWMRRVFVDDLRVSVCYGTVRRDCDIEFHGWIFCYNVISPCKDRIIIITYTADHFTACKAGGSGVAGVKTSALASSLK